MTRISRLLGLLVCGATPYLLLAANTYVQHNLVSDVPGLADHTDPGLVNPWGISESATSPFWLADNRSGLSTLYNSNGAVLALKVTVPSAAGAAPAAGTSRPTGTVFNGTTGFTLAEGKPASFLFDTEDGTISGWNSSVNQAQAIVKVDNSGSGAVYKGLAIGNNATGTFLYAANFHSGTIDVIDSNFAPAKLSGSFADPAIPAGFAPFNIQNLGGKLYVAYAKQDSNGRFDVPGSGNGYVSVFDTDGHLLQHLVSGAPLNSPWGLAIAAANFGDFANDLLVGNFGDGTINVFDLKTGSSLGPLKDQDGNTVVNQGLWALQFGNGGNGGDKDTLYFTAGISGPSLGAIQSHGLFGSIQAAPALSTKGVLNGGSFQPAIAANTWISIFGVNLAATARAWQTADFAGGHLPTELDGVSVLVNGKPAYLGYISPRQLNVLVPADAAQGPIEVQTSNGGLAGNKATAQLQNVAPALFLFSGGKYVAAIHSDGKTFVGPTTLFQGASTPAKPGEVISIYATGFGATTPPAPDGEVLTAPEMLAATPTVLIGGTAADVSFAGLTGPGLYQFNAKIPDSTPDGDIPVVIQLGGFQTQANVVTAVQK